MPRSNRYITPKTGGNASTTNSNRSKEVGDVSAIVGSTPQGATVTATPDRSNLFTSSTWWRVDLDATPAPPQGATPLVRRCMIAYGWSECRSRRVLKAYRQFLH